MISRFISLYLKKKDSKLNEKNSLSKVCFHYKYPKGYFINLFSLFNKYQKFMPTWSDFFLPFPGVTFPVLSVFPAGTGNIHS